MGRGDATPSRIGKINRTIDPEHGQNVAIDGRNQKSNDGTLQPKKLSEQKEGDGTSSSCEKAMQHNKLEKSIENHCIVEKGKWPGRVGEESYGKSTVTMPQNREEDAGGGCENWKCSFSAGKIWMDGCSE